MRRSYGASWRARAGRRATSFVVNAAAALVAAGTVGDFREGAGLASFVISSGAANEKLAALAAFTSEK